MQTKPQHRRLLIRQDAGFPHQVVTEALLVPDVHTSLVGQHTPGRRREVRGRLRGGLPPWGLGVRGVAETGGGRVRGHAGHQRHG